MKCDMFYVLKYKNIIDDKGKPVERQGRKARGLRRFML